MLEEKAKKLQKRKQLADEKRENDKVKLYLFLLQAKDCIIFYLHRKFTLDTNIRQN